MPIYEVDWKVQGRSTLSADDRMTAAHTVRDRLGDIADELELDELTEDVRVSVNDGVYVAPSPADADPPSSPAGPW